MKRKIILLLVLITILLLSGCEGVHLRGRVPNYEEETYTVTSGIKKVILYEEDVSVRICPSNNGKLYFSYYCADDGSEMYKIEEEKGKVTVTKKSKPNFGIFIFGDQYASDSYKNAKLTVYIPNDYKGDLSIRTQDGDVAIGEVAIDNLIIDTKDGDVSFNNTNIIRELCCKTKDGDVKGVLAGRMSEYIFKVSTVNGDNNLDSNTKGNKIMKITTKDGDINISFDKKGNGYSEVY